MKSVSSEGIWPFETLKGWLVALFREKDSSDTHPASGHLLWQLEGKNTLTLTLKEWLVDSCVFRQVLKAHHRQQPE